MSILELYLLTTVIKFGASLGGIQFFSIIIMVIALAGLVIALMEDAPECRPILKKVAWSTFTVGALAWFLQIVIPDEKQIAIIIAGNYVTNSDEVKRLPDNLVKTLNDLLEKGQEKLKPVEPSK